MKQEKKQEIWKDIAGFEGLYQISSWGRVKSLKNGKEKILRSGVDGGGYLYVVLYKDRKYKNYKVHRLVANAFIPNPDNLPVINHIDECKTNNFVGNLEWCSYSYNNSYNCAAKKRGEKLSKQVGQYSLDGELLKVWTSLNEAERNGFNEGNICSCCKGKRKTHGGFIWKYIEINYLKR